MNADEPTRKSNGGTISFLGFRLSKRTDIVAFAALLLSLITIFSTVIVDLWNYSVRSILHVYLPEHVQLLYDHCVKPEFYHVGVIAPVTYFNTGKYDDLAVVEKLYVSTGTKRMQLYPYRIVKATKETDTVDCDTRQDGEFKRTSLTYGGSPLRASVKAGSAVSREILFARDLKMCDEELEDCQLHDMAQYIDLNDIVKGTPLVVELRVRFQDDGLKGARCEMKLTSGEVSYFRTKSTVTSKCDALGF